MYRRNKYHLKNFTGRNKEGQGPNVEVSPPNTHEGKEQSTNDGELNIRKQSLPNPRLQQHPENSLQPGSFPQANFTENLMTNQDTQLRRSERQRKSPARFQNFVQYPSKEGMLHVM